MSRRFSGIVKRKQVFITVLDIVSIIIILSVSLLSCAGVEQDTRAASEEFQISFKLDERLFGPTYGGERWVPPPYGPVAYSGAYSLVARTYYIDAAGQQVAILTEWIPTDPDLVNVSPGKGHQVAITVLGLGETSLLVKTSQGTTQTLYIKASAQNDLVHLVEISSDFFNEGALE